MKYFYETHMHTREASGCASASGKEMAQIHKKMGYTGIFVTDHFFNGNNCIPKNLPWKERVKQFCLGYENAKAEGERIGLDVFFGFEYAYHCADFLVYNLDKEWLIQHEDIDKWPPREAFSLMRREGAFIVQAHPFRERDYIYHIELFPRDIDAVEAINGSHWDSPEWDTRARAYAGMYDLPVTAGSDSHHLDALFGSGVRSEKRFQMPLDYLKQIQAGTLELVASSWAQKQQ